MPLSWPNFTPFQEDVDASAYISIGPEMGVVRFPQNSIRAGGFGGL
jgi:hypothetical protein